jgi:hypothetical protein
MSFRPVITLSRCAPTCEINAKKASFCSCYKAFVERDLEGGKFQLQRSVSRLLFVGLFLMQKPLKTRHDPASFCHFQRKISKEISITASNHPAGLLCM